MLTRTDRQSHLMVDVAENAIARQPIDDRSVSLVVLFLA